MSPVKLIKIQRDLKNLKKILNGTFFFLLLFTRFQHAFEIIKGPLKIIELKFLQSIKGLPDS